ncbi:hypothetical protein ABZT43_23980 [Streptomyces sp. NPDC005349]|uniref:hypothetical protein n=1 Tax=Streptomyces sp. NPDC005349 TaxID=3157037 RepID=UPI0033A2E3D2
MDKASGTLLELGLADELFVVPEQELRPLRLEAANAVLAERRQQVPILERRASEAGIQSVTRAADLVPLLFPHTAYKSYPAGFVERKRWDDLARWLNTLASDDLTKVDFSGVSDEDEWVDRLREHGHFVMATSGTTGKCSFLPHSAEDRERKVTTFNRILGWPFTRPDRSHAYFWLGPHKGLNSAVDAAELGSEAWATPENRFFLTDERLRLTDVSRMAAMRRKMADGSATPSEIQAFEQGQRAHGRQVDPAIESFADALLDHRHEKLVISGLWNQHLLIRERARARGIPDGDFHPETVVSAGGGVKNVRLPENYKEQVSEFYGQVLRPGSYGMTETFQLMQRCEKLRYHIPPALFPLVLDRTGETLLNTEDTAGQVVEGRFAFVDFSITGRWSGTITSDKVALDTNPQCHCGRPGPTILDTITRYQTDDDAIGCAGTIDSYIRGALS